MTAIAVDPSALVAILLPEPDAPLFDRLLFANEPLMSIGSRIELVVVARRRLGPGSGARVQRLLNDYRLRNIHVDEEQAQIAEAAFDRFGKGRGAPPAVLNYGDLFSYALARSRDLPLLYKGDDFAQTDVRSAVVELAG